MEHRSISSKLPIEEYTELKAYCEKKHVTPSSLIRELILREIRNKFPRAIAGKNVLKYNKDSDNFSWTIKTDILLDDENESNDLNEYYVISDISIHFLNDLQNGIIEGLKERDIALGKVKEDSVPIPVDILRGKK